MSDTPPIDVIPVMPFGMVNAFLMTTGKGAVLIDAGLPGSERRVEVTLRRRGMAWSDLRLVIITHGHIDHAGAAARIRELSGAPIVLHQDDADYCRGKPPVLRPTGTFGRLFRKTGAIESPFPPFEADRLLIGDETMDLASCGLSGHVLHTPGHTLGSVSILLDDGTAFASDLVASGILLGGLVLRNRPKRPPFEEDPRQVANSLQRLLDLGATRFLIGHGGPLGVDQVRWHIGRLRRLPSWADRST
ncbi:MBL fold metallo-hydrolase [Roseibium sp.]|uniref:MBL fold metallo-hydrolase n=1 Tax=Roseibium sp. TaxID=1936156 RepID=UPI003A97F919